MHHLKKLIVALVFSGITAAGLNAKSLTEQEQCAVDQAEAASAYVQCLSQARIAGIEQGLSSDQAELLLMECEATMLEQAEALAVTLGKQCDTTVDTLETALNWKSSNQHSSPQEPVRPQIPETDFQWTGTFVGNAEKLGDPQIETKLVIRGQKKGRYFNLYMQQGYEGSGTWVENILYKNKLYTITHEWHTYLPPELEILGNCFENTVANPGKPLEPLPITVQDLNGILLSSRLVGEEEIDGEPMNHFRTTCLSKAGIPDFPWIEPFLTINIFSDIYVPPGQPYNWSKWLQFGDGVGPDPQFDEWFLFDRWDAAPEDIVLPKQCRKKKVKRVQQAPCSNLVPKKVR